MMGQIIWEVKAARHDLRQHLEVMRAYLEKKDTDGALAYVDLRGFAKHFAGDLPAPPAQIPLVKILRSRFPLRIEFYASGLAAAMPSSCRWRRFSRSFYTT